MGEIAKTVLLQATHIISLQERIERLQDMKEKVFRSEVLKALLNHSPEGTGLGFTIAIAFNEAINELGLELAREARDMARVGEQATKV